LVKIYTVGLAIIAVAFLDSVDLDAEVVHIEVANGAVEDTDEIV
jgi:hypothetical protein